MNKSVSDVLYRTAVDLNDLSRSNQFILIPFNPPRTAKNSHFLVELSVFDSFLLCKAPLMDMDELT